MESVNMTIKVDRQIKLEFDKFCENVGMNASTAINMFIRAALRTRELPFTISDVDYTSNRNLSDVLRAVQNRSAAIPAKMTIDEIEAIIKLCSDKKV